MLQELINHNSDLQKLVDNDHQFNIEDGYLKVTNVVYLGSGRKVLYDGILLVPISVQDFNVSKIGDHTVNFIGEFPCDKYGQQIELLRHSTSTYKGNQTHVFSLKNNGEDYPDIYSKVNFYTNFLLHQVWAVDKNVKRKNSKKFDNEVTTSHHDSFASRIGISEINSKLKNQIIGIIGIGGTGSYVLDLVSKCPVKQIYLYDGDSVEESNSMRFPGNHRYAAGKNKAEHFKDVYEGIAISIDFCNQHVSADTIHESINTLDFAFVCVDNERSRNEICKVLQNRNIKFIDCGASILKSGDLKSLLATVRTSYSGNDKSPSATVPVSQNLENIENEYSNIQIAEINALNAAFAVIAWKQSVGIYHSWDDLENNLDIIYSSSQNILVKKTNEN